jgi:hypothetical protein
MTGVLAVASLRWQVGLNSSRDWLKPPVGLEAAMSEN